MNLQEIRAFILLSEELHFTRAAERLDVSQPQFSQLIRRFEQQVGVELVERTTRAVSLTKAGEAALLHAKNALQEMRLIHRSAQGHRGHIQGAVRLGYAGASSRPWLPAIARTVRKETPGVDLRLESMVYGAQGPGRIVSGELDITFSRRPLAHPGLLDQVFDYEEVLVGLPTDHPLARESAIELSDLRNEQWVMFPGTSGSNVRAVGMRLTAEAGFVPRIAQEAPDSYTILGLVAAGVGVTLTVSSVAHVTTPGLRFLPLAGGPKFLAATVVWSVHAGPATKAVMEVITRLKPPPPEPVGQVLE